MMRAEAGLAEVDWHDRPVPKGTEQRTVSVPFGNAPKAGGGCAADRQDLWAVVLAGGAGTRLRGFVRQVLGSDRPKQFCRIVGSRSMLRHTWDRAARVVDPDRIVTIITAGQERYLDDEAQQGIPGTVVVQPENRETAPGLLLPLLWVARRAPAARVAVFPADHFVWAEERFAVAVRSALAAAEYWPRRLVLLGVQPEGPETGYGWIVPGAPLAAGSGPDLYAVRRFWEKPDEGSATRLFAAGCLWNTLVVAGRLGAYLDLAAACVPHITGCLGAAADQLGTPAGDAALAAAYCKIPPTELSRAVLAQRPDRLLTMRARAIGWSDWGDPDRIVRTLHRFHQQPSWLPAGAAALAQPAAGM